MLTPIRTTPAQRMIDASQLPDDLRPLAYW